MTTVSIQKVRGIATRNGIEYVDRVRSHYPTLANGIRVQKGYEGIVVTVYGNNDQVTENKIKDILVAAFAQEGFICSASSIYSNSLVVKAGA